MRDRNCVGFCVGIEIGIFVRGFEVDFVCCDLADNPLVFMYGSKFASLVRGSRMTCFFVRTENDRK